MADNGVKRWLGGLYVLAVVQIASLIWWCAKIDTRMAFAERDISRLNMAVFPTAKAAE